MEFMRHGKTDEKEKARGKIPRAVCSRGVLILAVVLFVLAAFFGRAWAAHGDGGLDSGDNPALLAFDGSRRGGGSPADPGTGGNAASDNDAAAPFTVVSADPPPVITGLDPSWAWEGTREGPILKVTGENFKEDSKVLWNGDPQETQYINPQKLQCIIWMSYLLDARTATVKVRNGDGQVSNIMNFEVIRKSDAPKITALEPSWAWAGGEPFELKVKGENFRKGSVVLWEWTLRNATYDESEKTLKASVYAWDLRESRNAEVRVETPNPGGLVSRRMLFTIKALPGPRIGSLKPSAAKAGGDGFTLMVTGENFGEGSTVRWNGWDRVTQYKSAGELTATIPADDISRPNAVTVTVKNADGQESGGVAFTVMEAAGLEPPSPFVLPPPSREITTTKAACVRGRYLSPITDVTVGRKDGRPCAITARDVIVEDTSVRFNMVMPSDTAGGEHVIRLHYGQDEPQTLDVPMTILVARPPTPHP